MSLKKRTVSGFIWAFLDQMGSRGMIILIHLILSWLILPEFFGVIATVSILMQIIAVLVDGGLGAALVQRKETTRTDISTVFYFNMVISTCIFLGMWALSPWIADYFEEPRLKPIIPVLAFGVVIASTSQTQMMMMIKQLQFRKIAMISFPATLVGGIVGVTMAFANFSIWALVGQKISTHGVRSILLWRQCPKDIQPNFQFSWGSLKRLSGLSLGLLGSNLIMRITRNLIELIIQKNFGSEKLGYYTQSRFFQKAPTEPLLSVLNRVLFPVFSEIQDDHTKIKKSLRTGVPVLIFFVAGLMLFMIASAKALIVSTISDRWLPAVEYMRVVPLIGITFALAAVKSNIIRAKGDGSVIFFLSLFRNGLSIVTLCFTWKYGIMPMIIGQIICYVINMTVNDIFTQRYIGYRITEQWADWIPTVMVAAASAALTYPFEWWVGNNAYVTLAVQMIIFATSYLVLSYVFRLPAFEFLVDKWKIGVRLLRNRNSSQSSQSETDDSE